MPKQELSEGRKYNLAHPKQPLPTEPKVDEYYAVGLEPVIPTLEIGHTPREYFNHTEACLRHLECTFHVNESVLYFRCNLGSYALCDLQGNFRKVTEDV